MIILDHFCCIICQAFIHIACSSSKLKCVYLPSHSRRTTYSLQHSSLQISSYRISTSEQYLFIANNSQYLVFYCIRLRACICVQMKPTCTLNAEILEQIQRGIQTLNLDAPAATNMALIQTYSGERCASLPSAIYQQTCICSFYAPNFFKIV